MDLPYLNAYLDSIGAPSFRTGCNFATGGATILPANAASLSPFSFGLQVAQFIRFKARVLELLGKGNGKICNSSYFTFHERNWKQFLVWIFRQKVTEDPPLRRLFQGWTIRFRCGTEWSWRCFLLEIRRPSGCIHPNHTLWIRSWSWGCAFSFLVWPFSRKIRIDFSFFDGFRDCTTKGRGTCGFMAWVL